MADAGAPTELLEPPTRTKVQPPQFLLPEQPKSSLITPEEISNENVSRTQIIQELTKPLDQGKKLGFEITKALFERAIDDYGQLAESEVPLVIKPGTSPTFPKGLYDDEIGCGGDQGSDRTNGVLEVAYTSLRRLDLGEKVEAVKYLIKVCDKNPNSILNRTNLAENIVSFIKDSTNKTELLAEVLDYLYQQRRKYQFVQAVNLPFAGAVNEFAANLTYQTALETILLLSQDPNQEKQKTVLGMLVVQSSLPEILNQFHQLLKNLNTSEDDKVKIEKLASLIFGPNLPFTTQIEQLYNTLPNFKEYTPSEVTDSEIKMIEKTIQEMGLTEGTIVDLGCGYGRIANSLAERFPRLKIIGIDLVSKHLQEAQATDKTHSVTYLKADWKKTSLLPESVDLVICLGRNLPHEPNLDAFFYEVSRVLKVRGRIIFDLANPEKGAYLVNREKYRQLLRNVGIPVDEIRKRGLKISSIDNWVIDSPNGKDFCLRYTPGEDEILKPFHPFLQLFDIEIVQRQPIPGWEGSENIYYQGVLAEKKFSWERKIRKWGPGDTYPV